MKVLIVRRKWPHHAKFSGYDGTFNLFTGKGYLHLLLSYKKNYFAEGLQKILQPFSKTLQNGYTIDLFFKELRIGFKIIRWKPDVVHITFFEEKYKILRNPFFTKRTKFVGTCHLPVSIFKLGSHKVQWMNFAKRLILLDENSCNWMSKYLSATFIPHPVNTLFFTALPNKPINNPLKCLFAGRFLRDWDTVCKVVRLCNIENLPVEFHILHPPITEPHNDWYEMLGILSYPNVNYYKYVSDDKLKELYQTSDILLSPMYDSTANNVVLEVMACGTPAIITRTPGIVSYVDESCSIIHEQKDDEGIVKSIRDLISNPDKLKLMSRNAQVKVKTNFTQQKVNEQLIQLYKEIANS